MSELCEMFTYRLSESCEMFTYRLSFLSNCCFTPIEQLLTNNMAKIGCISM